MEAIIFMGIQATGKSRFYETRFSRTHMRINLDMLKTRNREQTFLQTCLDTCMPFVIDNTNPTPGDRKRYIEPAQENGYRIIGYFFQSRLDEAMDRNAKRNQMDRASETNMADTASKLEMPTYAEGYHQLYFVSMKGDDFQVLEWQG